MCMICVFSNNPPPLRQCWVLQVKKCSKAFKVYGFNFVQGGAYLQAKSRMYNLELSITRKFPTKKRR